MQECSSRAKAFDDLLQADPEFTPPFLEVEPAGGSRARLPYMWRGMAELAAYAGQCACTAGNMRNLEISVFVHLEWQWPEF